MKIQKTLIATAVLSAMMLSNPASAQIDSTDTGLNKIVEIIHTDKRLQKRTSETARAEAAEAAKAMNDLVLEAIYQEGLANDGLISTADIREVNNYLVANHKDQWSVYHGDDEDGSETGFHQVQNNGNRTRLLGKNAINKVADSIYHLGFETHYKNRLMNEDEQKNRKFKVVAKWVNALVSDDIEQGKLNNDNVTEVAGTTGTGLDQIIDIIYTDRGLQRRVSTSDIRVASQMANNMNNLIIEAVKATGAANDGVISADDVRNMNDYLVTNHQADWALYHGDDENGDETGFHRVQNDGAKTRLFGKNLVNNVADSIYHLGFVRDSNDRLQNEDGNANKRFKRVAAWLNLFLLDDMDKLKS